MIQYVSGNLWSEDQESTDCIIASVTSDGSYDDDTTLGDMQKLGIIIPKAGGGTKCVARYSGALRAYEEYAKDGVLPPGSIVPSHLLWQEKYPLTLILAVTRQSLDSPAELAHIETCVTRAVQWCKNQGIQRISLPLLGTGRGKLSVKEVGRAIAMLLAKDDGIRANVFIPPSLMPPNKPRPR